MALALSSHAVAVPALLMSAPADAARPGKRACKALEDSPSSYADSSLHLAADGALPEELVLVVCAELDAPSLLAFGATCKRFAALAVSHLCCVLRHARSVQRAQQGSTGGCCQASTRPHSSFWAYVSTFCCSSTAAEADVACCKLWPRCPRPELAVDSLHARALASSALDAR